MLPGCFTACRTCSLHAEGTWRPQHKPPYQPEKVLLEKLGLNDNHDLGACRRWDHNNASQQRHKIVLPAQKFEPKHCTLHHYSQNAACEVLRDKSVMLVGDSLTAQLFDALMLHLGGKVEKGKVHAHAEACGGRTRLVYIRSDLALWSPIPSDYTPAAETRAHLSFERAMLKTNRFLVLTNWEQRGARDADILILGPGHHYGLTSWVLARTELTRLAQQRAKNRTGADGQTHAHTYAPPRPDNGLLVRAVNYTLKRVVEARRKWGHSAESTIVLGAPVPIPACRRYTRPLTLAEALQARLGYSPEVDPLFAEAMTPVPANLLVLWQQLFEMNSILQYTAMSSGTSFLDVAPISMTRPDGAAAHGGDSYDCLHSCEPGPVDTYARLLLGLVDDNRAVFLGGARPSPSRFFAGRLANASAFVTSRSTYEMESCSEGPACRDEVHSPDHASLACCSVSPMPSVVQEDWWRAFRSRWTVPLASLTMKQEANGTYLSIESFWDL